MQLFIPGEDTFFEVMPLNKGKKVKNLSFKERG